MTTNATIPIPMSWISLVARSQQRGFWLEAYFTRVERPFDAPDRAIILWSALSFPARLIRKIEIVLQFEAEKLRSGTSSEALNNLKGWQQ